LVVVLLMMAVLAGVRFPSLSASLQDPNSIQGRFEFAPSPTNRGKIWSSEFSVKQEAPCFL
jgi:hypothetical protein